MWAKIALFNKLCTEKENIGLIYTKFLSKSGKYIVQRHTTKTKTAFSFQDMGV